LIVELINTGSELMLGRVLNTHQQWLCRQLADLGYVVSRQIAIPDSGPDIEQAVREALTRADLVITTGGLGPTSDDITRDLIAQMLGRTLRTDAPTLEHIKRFFTIRNRPVPERTAVQALVPEGALVLPNPHGTAPGLAIEISPGVFRAGHCASWLIMLPGPSRELRPMFAASVAPLLQRALPLAERFCCRTLRTTGLGESQVEESIREWIQPCVSAGLQVGYCARAGEVDVRLSASGESAEKLLQEAETTVRARLAAHIFCDDEQELEAVVVRLLAQAGQTLALAESCTGGCVAHRLTNVPGASAIFLAGLVTYSNAAKQTLLGVRRETLEQHGAVSEAVAREMAEGARLRANADFALAITGIAGPSGGLPDKPVGTVFIALAGAAGTRVSRQFNPYDRETFKQVTAQQALDLLRHTLLEGVAGA
jgi:nicotinamide-nucleotide amidase